MLSHSLTSRIRVAATQTLKGLAVTATAASFWLAPCGMAMADDLVQVADDAAVLEQQDEDSVLIATRQALEESYNEPEGTLEPISQVSEYEPSPAEPPQESEPPSESAAPNETAAPSESTTPIQVQEPQEEESAAAVIKVTDRDAPRVASHTPITPPGDVASAFLHDDQQVAAAPFKGIIAGKSTKDELLDLWGQPSETHELAAGELCVYNQDRFALIEVKVEEGVVSLIKAQLEQQSQPDRLAAKLRVDAFDSVTIKDEENGENLGIAYPEKGLMLLLNEPKSGVTPLTPQFVTHLVLQAPDAEAFALRAHTRPDHTYSKRLADLDQALAIDSNNAYALWLRSGVYLSTGQPVKAEADAAAALAQEEQNPAYLLRWCESLASIGRYDDAVIETRKVIDNQNSSQLVKAQALALMGDLASLGDADIAEKAIGFHTTAITVADPLATSKDPGIRRAAKRLLIESHLAVGVEVSRRSYEDKDDVVAQWIGRASGLAEEFMTNEQGSLELRLKVARRALEALANFKPAKDPGPWVSEASEAANGIVTASDDSLQKHAAHWELGQSLLHAMRIAHTRREAERAIAYGEKAIDHFAAGSESGDVRPEAEQLVGRLFFHLGAVHAVHNQDHTRAVEWYDQALPLLTTDTPKSDLVVPRQLGEALVSMGVSYWSVDQQPKAMELTVQGAEIMKSAVNAKVLDRGAMAVPYGNLSTMHRKRGEDDLSSKYATLAAQARQNNAKRSGAVAKQPNKATQQRSAKSTQNARTAQRQQSGKVSQGRKASQSKSSQRKRRATGQNSTRKGILR